MKKNSICIELSKLLKILKESDVIHITMKGNCLRFTDFRNEKIFFSIPNHKNPKRPYIKSISSKQFCELLHILIKKKTLTKEDFPFKDCRKQACLGLIKIFNKNLNK